MIPCPKKEFYLYEITRKINLNHRFNDSGDDILDFFYPFTAG
jgi:hypothetical protein